MKNWKVTNREILMSRPSVTEDGLWMPANDVLLLHEGLFLPLLYNPRTGKKFLDYCSEKDIHDDELRDAIEKDSAESGRFEHALLHAVPLSKKSDGQKDDA